MLSNSDPPPPGLVDLYILHVVVAGFLLHLQQFSSCSSYDFRRQSWYLNVIFNTVVLCLLFMVRDFFPFIFALLFFADTHAKYHEAQKNHSGFKKFGD
jgi:hypothetical protein